MHIRKHEGRWYIQWSIYRIHSPTFWLTIRIFIRMLRDKKFRRYAMTPEE